ncbi:MAG: response regulator transcription factor [Planctomycetes bacterium]|nr:response regulator transcription factor [Planctomycetota bacterium]
MPRNETAKPARVLIVDDHPAVREALALRISRNADLLVCGEASDLAEALQLISETKPDVAVIDISLKTGNGLDLIKRIKARGETVRMLVWSMYQESLYAERVLQAGALGYITKEQATDKIVDAIRRVLEGKIYLSEAMTEKLLIRIQAGSVLGQGHRPEERLSDRELEVFQLIGSSFDTQEIATRLKVSPKTVETYRFRMKEKLNITDSKELFRRALHWVEENH